MPLTRVIIDTDPGIDDAVALALAVLSPELEVAAVTTTYGNAPLAFTTANAFQTLRIAAREGIPVLAGTDRPLARDLVTAPETHGATGIGYAEPGGLTDQRPNPTALLEVLGQQPGPVTLVTLGPLTNLAHALAEDPGEVRHRVSRHIGMFGNLNERGNTNRYADFNAWCDPEATAAVLEADIGTLMVGLDVTRRMVVTAAEVEWLRSQPDRLASWLGDAMRFYVEFHRSQERLDGCVVNDILTIGEIVHPGLLTTERFDLVVDVSDGEERGRTVVAPGSGTPTEVATGVAVGTMREILDRVFSDDWRKGSL